MTYTKEFVLLPEGEALCMIVGSENRPTLQYTDDLYQEARKDFPGLMRTHAKIVSYPDSGWSPLTGIKFYCPIDMVPSDYIEVTKPR